MVGWEGATGMMKFTLEELVAATQELPAAQKAVLVYHLQQPNPGQEKSFTREQALAELAGLRATGAFDHVESLLGKYPHTGVDLSVEELQATLRESATEWESELDEFFGDNV
jgi:hypothetical protein